MSKNNVIQIEIADLRVKLEVRSEWGKFLCADYISDSLLEPHICASVSEEEIEAEMGGYERAVSRDYCEFACIYRNIAEKLPEFDRFVFHGAAIEVDGKGYIFTAPPGTGKSTHISLWKQAFGDKVTVINGDKPILHCRDDGFWVCSTPWAGKEGWKTNISAPLGGICILARGSENKITKIDPAGSFDEILRQIYTPKDGGMLLKTLDMLDKLAECVPFYRLECNMHTDAARVARDMMIGNKK